MFDSGAIGAILVLVALLLFLSTRVALVTALGIPLSFLGGIIVAGSLGVTMNMIAMFALIVVLGMIVDDAIVVGENVYRRMEEGEAPDVAAVEGTAEVGRAVIATILTSIAAFLPVLMLTGTTGLFLRPLPLVVSACLVVSLVEAFTILPAHLAHWTSKRAVARMQAQARRRGTRAPLVHAPRGGLHGAAPLRAPLEVRDAESRARDRCDRHGGGVGPHPVRALRRLREQALLRERPPRSVLVDRGDGAVCEELEARVRAVGAGEVLSMHTLLGVAASDVSSYELGPHLGRSGSSSRRRGAATDDGGGHRGSSSRARRAPSVVESYEIAQPQTGPAEASGRGGAPGAGPRRPLGGGRRARREPGTLPRSSRRGADLESGKRQVTLRLAEAGRQVGLGDGPAPRCAPRSREGGREPRAGDPRTWT